MHGRIDLYRRLLNPSESSYGRLASFSPTGRLEPTHRPAVQRPNSCHALCPIDGPKCLSDETDERTGGERPLGSAFVNHHASARGSWSVSLRRVRRWPRERFYWCLNGLRTAARH